MTNKKKLIDLDSKIKEQFPEYEKRKQLEQELNQCIENENFFIKDENDQETKIIFRFKNGCIVYYKSKSVSDILKLEKDGSQSEEQLSIFQKEMIEKLTQSILKNKEVLKSKNFIKEVSDIFI